MAEEKVYTAEVIADQPLPTTDVSVPLTSSQASASGTYGPTVIQTQPIPRKKIALEVIGAALNSKTRKILAAFEFALMGALQIGKYENGVSGDVRISPNGITARDLTGLPTFALDGETGDATFKGTVRAGSFITGQKTGVTVGPEGVDGVDYQDIQQAINYVHGVGGGIILVKAGTYIIDSDLTFYSNICLVGEGRELTILDFQNNEHMVMMVGTTGTHLQNIVFESLTFQNLGRGDWFAFDMEYCDDCRFTNVKFYNITSAEINDVITLYMENSQRNIVENCYFDTCDQGIYVWGGSFHKFEFNYFTNIPSSLLNVGTTPSVIFRHNVAYDVGTEGNDTIIYFGSGGDNLIIDSNLFELCRTQCIWSEVGSQITITNNIFTKTGTTYECIFLSDCTRSILANNRIIGFTNSGIYFSGGCNYCTITGNVITGCGKYGVNIDHSSNNKNVVVGNALVSNLSGAVHDIGTSDVVANNSS